MQLGWSEARSWPHKLGLIWLRRERNNKAALAGLCKSSFSGPLARALVSSSAPVVAVFACSREPKRGARRKLFYDKSEISVAVVIAQHSVHQLRATIAAVGGATWAPS